MRNLLSVFFALPLLAADKPNILFILADDLGIKDLSCEGSAFYETPHIDSIAQSGMRFTNGYSTCQVCSPSRASIMSGQYPARIGITDWIGAATGMKWKRNDKVLPPENGSRLPAKITTVSEALKSGGYRTFFAGKWHIGGEGSGPEDHGFEVNKGGYYSGSPRGGYFAPFNNPKLNDGPNGEALPIRLARETNNFISQKNSKKPFFAFLSFYSVHGPIQTSPALWEKYRKKATASGLAKERFKNDRTLPVRQVQDCPIYGGMMESMDNAVGLVTSHLKKLGLDKNTIVIFTSDNGGVSSGDAFATACLPLRGGKGRQWEGGIRQPYYIVAPGVTKPGSTSSQFATGTDFYPTLLELAGLEQLPAHHIDGISLVPALRGECSERLLYWHYPHYGNQGGEPSSIIRDGDHKLIRYYEDGHEELYNVKEDISEANDLAAIHPDLVKKLSTKLTAHLTEVGAKIPKRDPRFDAEEKVRQIKTLRTKKKAQLEKQHANFLKPGYQPNKTWWGSVQTKD
ncbi:sulfatase [Akkermansiaceae bacterium]|jgi:arylsulfatase A-like enzyme|nr:sulfatase [Verrucomicrobiota bacterium]MDA7643104.1 sulfatase [Akkermansiaceae bacterium]MDB4656305.1 sulfatase [bacterium]MDA7651620.1 sulfatase [Akkermansiaceae bacterium]MDB4801245.1 sulfatase [Akkermansiaceae bacterium]